MNLYEHFGVSRKATLDEIEQGRLVQLTTLNMTQNAYYLNKGQQVILNQNDIDDIYGVLTTPELKEMYDKHENFIRP